MTDKDFVLQVMASELVMSEAKKALKLEEKMKILFPLFKYLRSEIIYIDVWNKIRDNCAKTGEWDLYDWLAKLTLKRDRKLFNKCVSC